MIWNVEKLHILTFEMQEPDNVLLLWLFNDLNDYFNDITFQNVSVTHQQNEFPIPLNTCLEFFLPLEQQLETGSLSHRGLMCSLWRWRPQQYLDDPVESLWQNGGRRGSRPDRTKRSAQDDLQRNKETTDIQRGRPEGNKHRTEKLNQLFLHINCSFCLMNVLGLMVSIGTKMFFRTCGGHKLSSNFTGDPDTPLSCFCGFDGDSNPGKCWLWGSDLTEEKASL